MPSIRSAYLAALTFVFLPVAANAIPITVTFEAVNFTPSPGPTDPVTGTIVFEAADLLSPIESLISIDLEISEHSYTLGEIGFANILDFQIFGGILNGVNAIAHGTNDFHFTIRGGQPNSFGYTVDSVVNAWHSRSFSGFSTTASVVAVSEPGTLALLGLGLVGIGLARRRIKI